MLLDSSAEGDVWTRYSIIEELWNWDKVNWKKNLQGYLARQLEV